MQIFWYKFTNESNFKILPFITTHFNDDANDSYIFTPYFHIVKVFQMCNRSIYILGLR